MAFDLMKAYFQQPCSRAHSEARSFYAPGMGVFRFNDRIGLGDASAPGAFSIAMDNFLGPIRPAGYVNYFDDVSVGTVNAEDLPNLQKILVDRSIEVGATFKLSSLQIGNSFTHSAGLRCDNSGIHAPALQLGKLASLEIPSSKTELRSYMGVLNYLDKFLPPNVVLDLKECVSPFLKKDQPESFDLSIHKEKFDKVHEALRNPLTLHDVKDEVQLIMSTDASRLGISGVLYQENPKDPEEIYIIDLWSHLFTPQESNWATIDQELFALFFGLQRCTPIIGGRNLLARVDHKNILGTALREHVVPRRIRMATFISEHDVTIVHVPGKSKMHSLAGFKSFAYLDVAHPDIQFVKEGEGCELFQFCFRY